jgi:lipopolysaccharide/colanic/teichoic acid biosynthesis glycosyltransferase
MSDLESDMLVPPAEESGAKPMRRVVPLRRSSSFVVPPLVGPPTDRECSILDEQSFQRMIAVERKRTERSRQPFLLVLLEAGNCLSSDTDGTVLRQVLSALSLATRETDVTGWYKAHSVVGVLFPEIEPDSTLSTLMSRVSETLRNNLTPQKFSQIGISMHVFPEDWNQDGIQGNSAFYPDLLDHHEARKVARFVKRCMDLIGSAIALLLFSPIFLVVAVLVKLSSKGPIFFRQDRMGQFGKPFTFLKFRSMYADSDHKIHQRFIRRVIKGEHDGTIDGGRPVYKMTNDPRITRVGRIIRRTSLDEFPQFINVFKGDMSLVGPRPPIEYECEDYDIWHRRRVLEVKPGITGLWQVSGRSRVCFDDMVRLDLQYARTWSLWLDIQILLKTPFAVLLGEDAF